jgi:hypothetical protein
MPPVEARARERAKRIATTIAVAGTIVAILTGSTQLYDRFATTAVCSADVGVTRPAAGQEVSESEVVEGRSKLSALKHYWLVIDPHGNRWIADGPFRPARCTVRGRVLFGSGTIGVGESFDVGLFATSADLRVGVIEQLPADVALSNIVRVKRSH